MSREQAAYQRGADAAVHACEELGWEHPCKLLQLLDETLEIPGVNKYSPFSKATALLAVAYSQFMTVGCGITRAEAETYASRAANPESPEMAGLSAFVNAADMRLCVPFNDAALHAPSVVDFAQRVQYGVNRYRMPLYDWRPQAQHVLGDAVHKLAQATVALVWARCSEMVARA